MIVVAKKYIYALQLFISRMPKMCAILQLVSASLNPIPIDHIRILSIGLELACNGG